MTRSLTILGRINAETPPAAAGTSFRETAMADNRTAPEAEDPHHTLRALGARAHQLRASLRAADHYIGEGSEDAANTGSWLISSAMELATDLTSDIDNLARTVKERPADAGLTQRISSLRVRTHQLFAAARAAHHFLDQDTADDRDTGSWLVATALGLAVKLASELDDSAVPARRTPIDKSKIEPHDAALTRRVAAATAPLRGAA